jgi:hypothetical protein
MDYYVIGSPVFEKVTINLPNGNQFVIEAKDNSEDNIYISSASLNKEEWQYSYLKHDDIMNGGKLELVMEPRPDRNWGYDPEYRPVSSIDDHLITPVPYFTAQGRVFRESMPVYLDNVVDTAVIRYSFGNAWPGSYSAVFRDTINLTGRTRINAFASLPGKEDSKVVKAEFFKLLHQYSVQIKNPYSSQYTGGGELALVDMIRGTNNFRTGAWQGYYGVDMEIIIDLGTNEMISTVSASFLEDQNSWIFKPTEVIFEVSKRQYDFKTVAIIRNPPPARVDEPVIHEYSKTGMPTNARYVKVTARNIGICPDWHKGAGHPAWIFADEISIN